MTHPDDTFDAVDPRDAEIAAWLDRHMGLPACDEDRLGTAERAAIFARVRDNTPTASAGTSGIVLGAIVPGLDGMRPRARRVVGLAATAALVVIVAAMLGAYLRSDRGERLPGAAATASVLPFAPGTVLASPAVATCATDATLVLNLTPEVDTGADGEYLYVSDGTALESIDLDLANGFALGNISIDLSDAGYQIVGASSDRAKVLLDQSGSIAEETSLWVDLDTGEIRELPGQPSRLFTEGILGVPGPIGRFVLLDDLQEMVCVVDMMTGEVIIGEARRDVPLISISDDGSTLLLPSKDLVALLRPAAVGSPVSFAAPAGSERVPTTFALPPNGVCAAGTWDLEGDEIQTVLLPFDGGEPITLPDATVGGWVVTPRG